MARGSTVQYARSSALIGSASRGLCIFAVLVVVTPSKACVADQPGLARIDGSFTPKEGETAFSGVIEQIGPPAPRGDLRSARLELAQWNEQFGGRAPDRVSGIPHPAFTYTVRVTQVISGNIPPRLLVEIGPCAVVDAWIGDEIRIKGKLIDGILLSN